MRTLSMRASARIQDRLFHAERRDADTDSPCLPADTTRLQSTLLP